MRTIISGSRNASYENVVDAINASGFKDEISLIISGTARGADTYGEIYAIENNIKIEVYPADWDTFGKQAGPIRNLQMAKNAEALIAVWDGESRGTKNMIQTAKLLGLKIFVFNYKSSLDIE
jgi:hypothetical protein